MLLFEMTWPTVAGFRIEQGGRGGDFHGFGQAAGLEREIKPDHLVDIELNLRPRLRGESGESRFYLVPADG